MPVSTRNANLKDIDQYELLGIDPSTGRMTLRELQARARQVSFLLLRAPATGTTAQPVPYRPTDANNLRDWLNQVGETEETARTELEMLDRFYRDGERAGWRGLSRWNPTAAPSDGSRLLHLGDPAVAQPLLPVERRIQPNDRSHPIVIDDDAITVSSRESSDQSSNRSFRSARSQAGPTGPTGPSEPTGRPAPGNYRPAYAESAPSTPSTGQAPSSRSGTPGHGAAPFTPMNPANRSPRVQPSPPPTGWAQEYTAVPTPPSGGQTGRPTTGAAPAALPGYTGPVMLSLAQLQTLAADPTGQRVVIGVVRAVDRSNIAYGPPVLVATAGLDTQGRLNFRVINRSVTGAKAKGAGQANSANWAGLTGRGLVLLGRFRNVTAPSDIRDFLVARGSGLSSSPTSPTTPTTPTTPATGPRSTRLPLHDQSPTQADVEDEKKGGQTGPDKRRKRGKEREASPTGRLSGRGDRRDRSPPGGGAGGKDAEEAAVHESWKYRGGRIRGG